MSCIYHINSDMRHLYKMQCYVTLVARNICNAHHMVWLLLCLDGNIVVSAGMAHIHSVQKAAIVVRNDAVPYIVIGTCHYMHRKSRAYLG